MVDPLWHSGEHCCHSDDIMVWVGAGVPCKDRAGTVEYVAPEVLRRNYGPEADIWSAGELCTTTLHCLQCNAGAVVPEL